MLTFPEVSNDGSKVSSIKWFPVIGACNIAEGSLSQIKPFIKPSICLPSV